MSVSETPSRDILSPFLAVEEVQTERANPAPSTLSPFTDETAFVEGAEAGMRGSVRDEQAVEAADPDLEGLEEGLFVDEGADEDGIDGQHGETGEDGELVSPLETLGEHEDEAADLAFDEEDDLLDGDEVDDVELEDEVDDPDFEAESSSGSTAEKVRWYQTILKVVHDFDTIAINGKHNDTKTRNAMRELQRRWKLKTTSGYLTVESNAALTQSAISYIYQVPSFQPFGKWTKVLRNTVRQFQRDYDLSVDGKVGGQTREKMARVLNGDEAMPFKNRHPYLPTLSNQIAQGEEGVEPELEDEIAGYAKPGVFPPDDRDPVDDTLATPHRWICRLEVRFGSNTSKSFTGTGILISPKHVLTCAHVVTNPIYDKFGRLSEIQQATSIRVIPAADGRPLRKRVFYSEPLGDFSASIQIGDFDSSAQVFETKGVPSEWVSLSKDDPDENRISNWDFAVIELEESTYSRPVSPKKRWKYRKRSTKYDDLSRIGYWGSENHKISVSTNDDLPDFTGTQAGAQKNRRKWKPVSNRALYSSGYPGGRSVQFTANGKSLSWIDHTSSENLRVLKHHIDTEPGQSGSPVWTKQQETTDGKKICELVGIMIAITYGQIRLKIHREYNEAVAITPVVVERIVGWYPDTFCARKDKQGRVIGLGIKKSAR